MALPINMIIKIKTDAEYESNTLSTMDGCSFTESSLLPIGKDTGNLLPFTSIDMVEKFFGTDSKEVQEAIGYFGNHKGSNNIAKRIWFGRVSYLPESSWIRSSQPLSDNYVNSLKDKYKDWTLVFYFGGGLSPTQSIVLSDTDLDTVDNLLTKLGGSIKGEGFPGAEVNLQSDQTIKVDSGLQGSDSTITYCTSKNASDDPDDSLAIDLGFAIDQAIISQGKDSENFEQNFNRITSELTPFVGFWFSSGIRNEEGHIDLDRVIEICTFLSRQDNRYMLFIDILNKTDVIAVVEKLKSQGMARLDELSDGSYKYHFNVPILLNLSGTNPSKLNAWVNGIMGIDDNFIAPSNKKTDVLIGDNVSEVDYFYYLEHGCNIYCRIKNQNAESIYLNGHCGCTGNVVGAFGSEVIYNRFIGMNRIRKELEAAGFDIMSNSTLSADESLNQAVLTTVLKDVLESLKNKKWIAEGINVNWETQANKDHLRKWSNDFNVGQEELKSTLIQKGYWLSNGAYISDLRKMSYSLIYIANDVVLSIDINLIPQGL